MRTVRRLLLAVAILAILAYCGALAWLVANETRIVFQGGRPLGDARPAAPFEQIELPRADGARQIAFQIPHGADWGVRPWVIYLHGNAATIGSRQNISRAEHLRALGLNVLAVEYRGYAGLAGAPSESTVTADARAAYDYLRSKLGVAPGRIVIYGWSLGSAVAVNLASSVEEAAVILEGAPASLVSVGQRQYPFVPIRLLMRNPFDSVLKVGRIRAPMLFLHSPEDSVIPIEEGRRLFDAAHEPKTFVEVKGGHIYSSDTDPQVFYGAIRRFLAGTRLIASNGTVGEPSGSPSTVGRTSRFARADFARGNGSCDRLERSTGGCSRRPSVFLLQPIRGLLFRKLSKRVSRESRPGVAGFENSPPVPSRKPWPRRI